MSLVRHDPRVVAQLIVTSAPELFRLLYGRAAVAVIQQFVQRSHNHFSHRYIHVAEMDHQVVGIAVLVPAAELNQDADSQFVLNGWLRLRQQLADRLILKRVLQRHYPTDSFYIANLAVDSAHQGHGIGTQLLQHCFNTAETAGAKQIFISVDIANSRAQKLYESLGFQVVATHTVSVLTMTIGSRVLARACG